MLPLGPEETTFSTDPAPSLTDSALAGSTPTGWENLGPHPPPHRLCASQIPLLCQGSQQGSYSGDDTPRLVHFAGKN